MGGDSITFEELKEALKTATLEDGTPAVVEFPDEIEARYDKATRGGKRAMGEHKHKTNGAAGKPIPDVIAAAPSFTDDERRELETLGAMIRDTKLKIAECVFQTMRIEELKQKLVGDVLRIEEQRGRRVNEMGAAKKLALADWQFNPDTIALERRA